MKGILEEIVDSKKKQLEIEMGSMTAGHLKQNFINNPERRIAADFRKALKTGRDEYGISVIAEIKKASPSKGIIAGEFNPSEIALNYHRAGVQAISVITEKKYFLGSDSYLAAVRQKVPTPLLRKDFIIDVRQVYQSAILGADAILLITAALDPYDLKKFVIIAEMLGMQCLVETHNRNEIETALECGATIIGINNRDLDTFEVDLETTARLIRHIPSEITVVSESGIKSADDVLRIKETGADAVLIGEAFMREIRPYTGTTATGLMQTLKKAGAV